MNKIIIFFTFLFYSYFSFSIYSMKNSSNVVMLDSNIKNLYNDIIISKNSKYFIIRYVKKWEKIYYYV